MFPRLAARLGLVAAALIGLAITGFTVAGALYEPEPGIPAGFAGKHVVVNGVRLRVLQRGSGRDVLLIHGSPGSLEDWSLVMDALDDSFRVTAFDRPGHGFSADTGEYSYEHNAVMALGLIDALGLENVIVAGHSYGGSTALAAAVRAPGSVAAYVIVDSSAYVSSREVRATYRLLAVPWLGTGFARALGPDYAKERIASGIPAEFRGTPPPGFIALRQRLWSSPKVMHALASEIRGANAGLQRISPKYGEIRRPTFIVAQADNEFRSATAQRLHRDIAGSTLSLVKGTGHSIPIERPLAVADAIRQAAASGTR